MFLLPSLPVKVIDTLTQRANNFDSIISSIKLGWKYQNSFQIIGFVIKIVHIMDYGSGGA